MNWSAFPGHELVETGLSDLRRGEETVESLLVLIGAPRLEALGVVIPEHHLGESPEHRLYELLARDHGDAAHSRYNALIRRLISFERAVACAKRRISSLPHEKARSFASLRMTSPAFPEPAPEPGFSR